MSLSQSDIDALYGLETGQEGETPATGQELKPAHQGDHTQHEMPQHEVPQHIMPKQDVEQILKLRVPIVVKLAERELSIRSIIDLTVGTILEFDTPSDNDLSLMVNDQTIGYGQAVKVGENFGLRIARVGSVNDRVHAMGG